MRSPPPRLPPRRPRTSGFVDVGLLGRVAVALAVVGLVPLLLASWRLTDINREAMQEQVLRANVVAASSAAARVSDLVSARAAVLEAAAESPLFAAARFASSPAGDAPDRAADEGLVGDLLTGLLAADPLFLAAVVVNDAGGEVLRAQRSGAPTAATLAPKLPRPGVPALVRADGGSFLVLSFPLAAAEGRLRGVWDAALLHGPLRPLAAGEQVRLVLGGADGSLLTAGDGGAPLHLATSEPLPAELLAQARSAHLAGAGRFQHQDQQILAAFDTVEGTPWFVVSHQPAAAAEQVGRRMRRDAALVVGLALLLALGVCVVAYGTLVQPLRRLLRTQRRMLGLAPRPSGGNEIDQLRDAFTSLERSQRDRRALEEVFLGRYQVLEVMGEGGMGTVFRGWDPRLQRPVALKTLRLDDALGRLDRLDRAPQLAEEAVLAARIQHPGVVAVYDVEDTPEVTFLAMEYVDGISLERLLTVRRRLEPAEVLRVGIVTAEALAAAHRIGVLHRDVKPGNVLLGRDGAVKVADFGVAALMSSLRPDEDLVYGTPGYVAPEALRGELPGPAADVFSLGVVLFRCLGGQHPFSGKDYRQTALATLRQPPPSLHRLRPELPAEMVEVVEALLEKDPAVRPGDGRKVAARLEEVGRRQGYAWDSAAVSWSSDAVHDREVRDASLRWDEVEKSRFVATVGLRS